MQRMAADQCNETSEHCAGDGCVARLALEVYYGNYTLQDLIQATSRLRVAVKALQGVGQLNKEDANAARGVDASGLDFLGQLLVH